MHMYLTIKYIAARVLHCSAFIYAVFVHMYCVIQIDYETEEIWEGDPGPELDEDIDMFCSDPTDYYDDVHANPFAMWLHTLLSSTTG